MKPLRNIHVTTPYGPRIHPVTKENDFHNGIDLRAAYEDTYAIADGTVEIAKYYTEGIGNCVVINHGTFMAVYGHLDSFNVKRGQFIEKGHVIGTTGNTGTSTGPHLHFEIRQPVPDYVWNKDRYGKYENSIDPIEFMKENDHWAQKYYAYLSNVIDISETRFGDKITRGEVFALLARLEGYKE